MEDFCPRVEAWDGARFLYATVHEGASAQETAHNCQHCADFGRMKDGRDMTLSFMAETPLFSGLPESVRASLGYSLRSIRRTSWWFTNVSRLLGLFAFFLVGCTSTNVDFAMTVGILCGHCVMAMSMARPFPWRFPIFFGVKNNGIPVNKG